MIFTPGHSPGHVTYAVDGALFSGDVLFQGSVGRTDLPGGDWPTLARSIAGLLDALPGRDAGLPGAHGGHDARPRARDEPLPARARRALSGAKFQAPRGTYDVLPEQADERGHLEETARTILEGAGYGRIETPVFESTELFARGVGESTDIVQKEMYTFEDGGGRSLTLRPEGTAPVCRAYLEHGMHKLPQPVKLWYLLELLPLRARAGRALPPVLAGGRRGDRLRRPRRRRRDDRPAARAARRARRAGPAAAAGHARDAGGARAPTASSCRSTCARTPTAVAPRCATASTSTRCARSTPTTPGRRRSCASAPLLLDHLGAEDREHFDEVQRLLDAADVAYEIDPTLVRGLDYYTRTIFEFTSDALGAQSGVGGGGRYDGLIEQLGGPHTPGMRLGRRDRADAARRAGSARRARRSSTSSSPTSRRPTAAVAFRLVTNARKAGRARADGARRALAQGPAQAGRPGRGALRCRSCASDGAVLKDMRVGRGERRSTATPMPSSPPCNGA